jgi:hypothetical protein
MHYGICPWYQEGGTLEEPGHKIKHLLTRFTRSVHLVRGIPVKKKSMNEERKKPMGEEKDENS